VRIVGDGDIGYAGKEHFKVGDTIVAIDGTPVSAFWDLDRALADYAGKQVPVVVERGGKSVNFGISLLILFGYYLLLVGAINLGEKSIAQPRFILWVPDALVFVLGIFLWRKMLKK